MRENADGETGGSLAPRAGNLLKLGNQVNRQRDTDTHPNEMQSEWVLLMSANDRSVMLLPINRLIVHYTGAVDVAVGLIQRLPWPSWQTSRSHGNLIMPTVKVSDHAPLCAFGSRII